MSKKKQNNQKLKVLYHIGNFMVRLREDGGLNILVLRKSSKKHIKIADYEK